MDTFGPGDHQKSLDTKPTMSKGATTFHPFLEARFPAELRQEIYTYAAAEPRAIVIPNTVIALKRPPKGWGLKNEGEADPEEVDLKLTNQPYFLLSYLLKARPFLRHEAYPTFFKRNTISIPGPWALEYMNKWLDSVVGARGDIRSLKFPNLFPGCKLSSGYLQPSKA